MSDYIKDTLVKLGYSLRDCGKEFRAKPIYRDSDNPTALAVNKQTGYWVDYAIGASGKFEELIRITTNLATLEDVKHWLNGNNITITERKEEKPTLKVRRTYPIETLTELVSDHTYWNVKRKISIETLRLFRGGLSYKGKLAGRYVFPIINSKNEIIGFTGRDIFDNSNRAKWKHIGDSMDWRYPMFLNWSIIQKYKKIFLLESIGDMLALWEAGIKNTMVLFGLKLGAARLKFLLATDPQKIIVALNNDEGQERNHGQEAAENIQGTLWKYFDREQVIIHPPKQNDFGVMTPEEIKAWHESCPL